jgi:integrase
MTPTEIERLIAQWMDAELEESEDYRALHRLNDDQREIMVDETIERLEATEGTLSANRYDRVAGDVDAMLRASGMPALDHNSLAFKRGCRAFLLAKQKMLTAEVERWQNIYRDHSRSPLEGVRPSPKEHLPVSKPFSEVVRLYFKENTRADRTDSQIKSEFEKFQGIIGGDRPIASITKADCRTYKDHVLKDRSQTTCIKHMSSLSGLFKWAEQQGFTPDNFNPVRGLSPNKRQAKKHATSRRPFTAAELLAVFSSREFLKQRETRPERYWLTLLCLFQICRREEAGQLALKDIGEESGIPFLNITDAGEEQGLKNEGSKRRLPLHSSLVALGFLEYVESMRAAGHSRLFPQLKKGLNGFSDAVGKWFSRMVTQAGLTDPALVLHSLRHGGISKLHGAGVQENHVLMLAGHAGDTVNRATYTHRETIPLSLLREGLERLRYDEVVKEVQREHR